MLMLYVLVLLAYGGDNAQRKRRSQPAGTAVVFLPSDCTNADIRYPPIGVWFCVSASFQEEQA